MSFHVPLHDGWSVTPADESEVPITAGHIAATVPGCVHTDLITAGLIPDPYLDDNERRLGWIGRTDWCYETRFAWPGTDHTRIDLVCEGLDTVATVNIDGVEVARTTNMHRGYRFDVGDLLGEGEHRLAVRFDSPYRYAERLRDELGDRPCAYPEPFNFIRKTACNFGWDWGPTLVTAGIWQPIGLHAWSTARLACVRPLVTVDDGRGLVDVHADLEWADAEPLILTATIDGISARTEIAPGRPSATVQVVVPSPDLWWPRGYGRQPRYLLEVTLSTIDGRALDTWRRHIGFRTVSLCTEPDEHGSAFTLIVNGEPVFVRGVNWIPDDVFPNRVGPDRYAARMAQACRANVNYLRVWGGGRYESETFYDLTDELGLLIGQDFLFACAAYPEEEPLASEVAAEAREQVSRLAGRPSLVMWTGNNENIWAYHDWGWREPLAGRTWGAGYYFDLLPRIVAELDPTVPYWPASPYSGDPGRHPNDPAHGTMHIWDVWNTHDYLHYRSHRPRFAAEFGYQAPPAYATLRRTLSDDPLEPDSPGMRNHQKAAQGDAKLRRGLDAHLPPAHDFDDWHYLTQLNQARAVGIAVEHLRALHPICMGAIVWQLNDCWPVTSWAAIDGDGRAKPLWHALRRAYADRLLTIQPTQDGLALVAINDSPSRWSTRASVTRYAVTGEQHASTVMTLGLAPRSVLTLPLPTEISAPAEPPAELLLAEADHDRAWWFFAEDRDVAYPTARYEASVERTGDGTLVNVVARTILRDLTIYPDRLDPAATVSDALVTLLPGESTTFTIRSRSALDPVALTTRPVLRCVNDLKQ